MRSPTHFGSGFMPPIRTSQLRLFEAFRSIESRRSGVPPFASTIHRCSCEANPRGRSSPRRTRRRGDDLPRGFASHEHLWIVDAKGGTPERLDSMDRNASNSLNCDVRMGGMNPDPKWVGDRIYFVAAEGGGV